MRDVPVPSVGRGDVLLRVGAASVCGTDVRIVRHGNRKLRDGQTIVLGHEFAGEIAEAGAGVTGYAVGQRVSVAPNAGCGQCDPCARGLANYCRHYTAFGIDRDGGHAEYVLIPAAFVAQGNVVPLPDHLGDAEASLLEPLSCVVGGIRRSRIELGDTVVICGAGPIGLMHVMLVAVSGAARIIVSDPQEHRLEKARALGADRVLNPDKEDLTQCVMEETGGRGADVVITACPAASAQEQAISLLAPLGRVCFFGGLPRDHGPIQLDSNAVHYGGFVVTGSTGGSVHDYCVALRMAAGGKVRLDSVISDVVDLSDPAAAYDKAQGEPDGKVVLQRTRGDS